MEVKKAIEFLENVLIVANMKDYDFDDSPGLVDRLQNLEIYNNLPKVVALLRQGEKYKQMWEAVFANYNVAETDNHYSDNKTKKKIKLNLEQKYFPKEAKKDDYPEGEE